MELLGGNMIDIIHRLRRTPSRNVKLKILQEEQTNKLWKGYLRAVYDPYTNYYITSVPDDTFYSAEEYKRINLYKMLEDIEGLSSRTYTGDRAKFYAKGMSLAYGELFRLILARSIDAGVTANSINKIYPGLIPDFRMMKGKEREIDEFPCWVSTKFDGARVLAKVERGKVTLHSSSGKQFPLDSLTLEMSNFVDGWYDGELVSGNGMTVSRTSITGWLNRLLKGTATEIDDYYKFMIFDYVDLEDWENRECNTPYSTRWDYLNECIPSFDNVALTSQLQCKTQGDINRIYEDLVERGYEGIIVRWMHDAYEWNTPSKRSNRMVKKKEKKECVLKCIGYSAGSGKYEGMIGALTCIGLVEGKDINVSVGSGLSDFDREQPIEYYLYRDLEIIYNSVVTDGNGYSLFLPRFKRRRGDV